MKVLENIKNIRKERGISQEAMAFSLGISQVAYAKIENRQTKLTLDRLADIINILECSIEEVFGIRNASVEKLSDTDLMRYGNLTQESKELYLEIIKAKDEQIKLLTALVNNYFEREKA